MWVNHTKIFEHFLGCHRMVELMFERYDVPALFLAKNAVRFSVLIIIYLDSSIHSRPIDSSASSSS